MANPIEIRFPADQQEGTEATVAHWLVKEGDRVAQHDPVVEIETDKVIIEVAAPETGLIANIKIQQDEEVNPDDVLCILNTDSASDSDQGSTPAPARQAMQSPQPEIPSGKSEVNKDRLSPAVKQRVLQHNLDVSSITGSGRGGRITLKDVEVLLASQSSQSETMMKDTPTQSLSDSLADPQIIPHDKMRQRIAKNMVASLLHTAPHVTAIFEADMTAVMRHRAANRGSYANRGAPLTLTVYFIAATIAAIRKVPLINSCWHEDHLEVFQHINIGIGTALGDQGLIVPVLKNAQDMDLASIATGLADLTSRARDGKLRPEDVRGGTFTISNHGVSGSLIAAPIVINQPQSAILGVGKMEKRVKIKEIDGEDVISIRPMCYVSNTIDHRVVDGFQSNAFLTELVRNLEHWS